jgi:hypothetical protein
MKKPVIVVTVFSLVVLFACSKSGDSGSNGIDCSVSRSYATDVSPIILSSCATSSGCHASGSTSGPGALTTYQQVYNARNAIRTAVSNGTMPQGSSLSTVQKNNIICWIDNGSANN